MQVERAHAPTTHNSTTYYLCSDRCHDRFVAEPGKYAIESAGTGQLVCDSLISANRVARG
ncbi:YHS domain-containing protein [Paenarthrobacter sp. Z7-10]|nr:YHS domain-containing protein [Paenarthrobacter sp. Z7-10]